MMKNKMIAKLQREGDLKDGPDGNPIRSYTNPSESMNHVMSNLKKDAVLSKNDKGSGLTKLEFTTCMFEGIHKKQQDELSLAITEMSEEYELSEIAAHLAVSSDTWFNWSPEERKKYIADVNKMSVEKAIKGKCISEPQVPSNSPPREFADLSFKVAKFLEVNIGYKAVTARHVAESALLLLNHPLAIQSQPILQPASNKIEVAAIHTRNGRVQCTVNPNFVSCNCNCAIAVAQMKGCLEKHMKYLEKKTRSRFSKFSLAEANVDKQKVGKNGGRNKYTYRPSKKQIPSAEAVQQEKNDVLYTELHHNDNPFVVRILPDQAKRCKTCSVDFCRRQRHLPFDLVLEHKERWYFPKEGDWKNKVATNKEAKHFYHPNMEKCLKPRFPYISSNYIQIPEDTLANLHKSHKELLRREFQINI